MAVNIQNLYGNWGNNFKKKTLAGIFNKKHLTFTPFTEIYRSRDQMLSELDLHFDSFTIRVASSETMYCNHFHF